MRFLFSFGDQCTADHWLAKQELSRGYDGETVGLTFRDRSTNWVDCRGLQRKTGDDAKVCLSALQGRAGRIKYMFTDGSGELAEACENLDIPHDHSTPGEPQRNARAERSVRHVLDDGVSLSAWASGNMSPHFWDSRTW